MGAMASFPRGRYNAGMVPGRKWKLAAVILGAIPVAFFGAFAIGEGMAGWSHYGEVLALIALLISGWFWPRIGGVVFLALGIAAMAAYPLMAHPSLSALIIVESLACLPVALSGIFFMAARR